MLDSCLSHFLAQEKSRSPKISRFALSYYSAKSSGNPVGAVSGSAVGTTQHGALTVARKYMASGIVLLTIWSSILMCKCLMSSYGLLGIGMYGPRPFHNHPLQCGCPLPSFIPHRQMHEWRPPPCHRAGTELVYGNKIVHQYLCEAGPYLNKYIYLQHIWKNHAA